VEYTWRCSFIPIFVLVAKDDEVIFMDKVSTIFFTKDFLELLRHIEAEYGLRFSTLHKLFMGEVIKDPREIVEDTLRLLMFTYEREDELPKVFFFVTFPRDFLDVMGILLGGASSIEIPLEDKTMRIEGGLGKAIIYEDGIPVRDLREGEELKVSTLSIKVLTKTAYDMVSGPLKTLAIAALVALRERARLLARDSTVTLIR